MLDYTSILKYLPITTATTADYILINSAGNNKKILLSDFISSLGLGGGGGGGVTSVTGVSPIASSGGTTPAISIGDAAADGVTKGAATFDASDFDSSSGVISIDYANGLSANAFTQGFLNPSDYTLFYGKQDPITLTTTGSSGAATFISNVLNVPNYSGGSATATDIIAGFTYLGSTQKGYALFNPASMYGSTASLANQRIDFVAYHITTTSTITGVRFQLTTAGVYTANNFNGLALYSYSAGTLTQVAITANTSTAWNAIGVKSIAFTAPYTAAPGVYFVASLYCSSAQTTAPAFLTGPVFLNAFQTPYDFTNGIKSIHSLTGATAFSSSYAAGSLANSSAPPLFRLY